MFGDLKWGIETGYDEEGYLFHGDLQLVFLKTTFEDVITYYLKMFISSHELILVHLLEKGRYCMHQYIKTMIRLQNESVRS